MRAAYNSALLFFITALATPYLRADQALALTKFVDALPIPARIQVSGSGPQEIQIPLMSFERKLHRDLPATLQWGYGGQSPGPTIEIESGTSLKVHWKNQLPLVHFLKAAKGVDMPMPVPGQPPDVRVVTHLHGADVTEAAPMDRLYNNDGWPDAWNVPGEEQIAEYPNQLSARTLWYHDHAMASTGRNVAAGLIGLYEIHDAVERSLNLPTGKFDIPLVLQARGVKPDGALYYTDDITNEFYGNSVSINGKLWPYLDVEPRKYRFRFVNTSNARTYILKLIEETKKTKGPAFVQITSDSGFLETPVVLNDPSNSSPETFTISPAERMDLVIDFSAYAGQHLTLKNSSVDSRESELAIPDLMQFRVRTKLSETDTSSVPTHLRTIKRLNAGNSAQTRRIVFDQMKMSSGGYMMMLNGLGWLDPVAESPKLGTTEIWELTNTLNDTHPFHIHGVEFQVLDRRVFDVAEYLKSGAITYIGAAVAPPLNEMGFKDTVRVLPQMVTRIIMRFSQHTGHFVYHCHILEHEDMDMMRPYDIVGP